MWETGQLEIQKKKKKNLLAKIKIQNFELEASHTKFQHQLEFLG